MTTHTVQLSARCTEERQRHGQRDRRTDTDTQIKTRHTDKDTDTQIKKQTQTLTQTQKQTHEQTHTQTQTQIKEASQVTFVSGPEKCLLDVFNLFLQHTFSSPEFQFNLFSSLEFMKDLIF